LLLGCNYFEIIVGFAIIYLVTGTIRYYNCNNLITNPFEALYYSAVTITGVGASNMVPISLGGILTATESILGLIFIVLVIGAFFTFYTEK
jgi:uncharacterized membrane protein YidH (DUF202 family)